MRLGDVTVMYPAVIIILCRASGPRKVSDCNVMGINNFISSTVGMNGKLVFLINRTSEQPQTICLRLLCGCSAVALWFSQNRRATAEQPQSNRRATAEQPQSNRRATAEQLQSNRRQFVCGCSEVRFLIACFCFP